MSSLAKIGLRLAMLEALAPHQTVPGLGYPTLARDRYHDSRFDPIDVKSRQPEVVISVEVTGGKSASDQNAGHPATTVVEIVFALTIFVEELAEDEQPTGEMLVAFSDADAEDKLDTLEWQILYALTNNPWVRKFAPRFLSEMHSEPYRDAETGLKFANRSVKIEAELAAGGDALLPAFLATLPAGERRDRGQQALDAMAQTLAFVDGDPLAFEGTDDTLIAQTVPPTPEPDATSRRIRFNAFGLPATP